MNRQAKILSSRIIYNGPVFGVRHDEVMEPGGIRTSRDLVTHFGSIVVLPILPDGRILLIRQYRHAVGQFMWELVAGRVEKGENLLAAAKRELLEETGYTARRYRKLLKLHPTPGFLSEFMVIYAAEGLVAGPAEPEEDERITMRALTLREAERWMRSGKLRDAKSVAGILYYARLVLKK